MRRWIPFVLGAIVLLAMTVALPAAQGVRLREFASERVSFVQSASAAWAIFGLGALLWPSIRLRGLAAELRGSMKLAGRFRATAPSRQHAMPLQYSAALQH